MELLKKNDIFFMAYNVMKDINARKHKAPRSFTALQRIGISFSKDTGFQPSRAQILFSWLIRHGYGIIPACSQDYHLQENLPQVIRQVPKFSDLQDVDVRTALASLLQGVDASEYHFSGVDTSKGVVVTFFNALNRSVKLFAVKNGRQISVSVWLEKGKSNRIIASRNDVFVAYDVHGSAIKRYRIEDDNEMEKALTIEL